MNALELKGSIIDLIAQVRDVEVLNEINVLIKQAIQQKKEKGDWWDQLTPNQQEELDKALDESHDESNWVTNDEAQLKIRQWLDR